MTEIELKQMCARMTRTELFNLLSSTERNYNIVYPFIEKYAALNIKVADTEKEISIHSSEARSSLISSAIAAGFALIFFIWRSTARNLGALLLTFLAIGAVATVLPTLFIAINRRKSAKKCERVLPALKAETAAAYAQVEQMKQQYKTDMLIRQWICPEQCWKPQYLRIFVSYFEYGRADSLKEAYALFDEMLHREKMEGLAHEQVRHAQAAEAAAYAAMNSANQAAADASRARSSADWAAFNTRFKY